jgi:hypothetical protein
MQKVKMKVQIISGRRSFKVKKAISLLITLILAISLLTGCASNEESASGKGGGEEENKLNLKFLSLNHALKNNTKHILISL